MPGTTLRHRGLPGGDLHPDARPSPPCGRARRHSRRALADRGDPRRDREGLSRGRPPVDGGGGNDPDLLFRVELSRGPRRRRSASSTNPSASSTGRASTPSSTAISAPGSPATWPRHTGYRVLGYWDNGFRHISNRLRPIRHPDDCRGMRIRTLDNAVYRQALAAMGFAPVTIDVKDLVRAVETHEVDAQENPLTNTVNFGLHRTHKHLSLTSHFYGVALLLANRAWLEALRPGDAVGPGGRLGRCDDGAAAIGHRRGCAMPRAAQAGRRRHGAGGGDRSRRVPCGGS